MIKKVSLILILVMSWSLAVMAGSDGAILRGSGSVQINGEQTAGSSTVFPGDRVQTGRNGFAMVRSSESLVSISADSSLKYEGTSVTLERGVVMVTPAKSMDARFGNLTISPAPNGKSKFELINANGVERIKVFEGSISVTDGTHVAKLMAGEMITHAPPEPTRDKGQGSALPSFVSHLPGWVIEVMIEAVIAGGIIGGLAASGEFDSTPVSPSHP